MKIAMYNVTTTTKIGGVETFIMGASRELAARGHKVDIVCGTGGLNLEIPEGIGRVAAPFTDRDRFPPFGTRFKKLAERMSFYKAAAPEVLAGDYDIIHIHKPYDLIPSWLIGRKKRVKVVLGIHGAEFFPLDTLFAGAADAMVACSEYVARQVETRYGVEVEVIYNGVDTERFCPGEKDPRCMRALGLNGPDLAVMYAGRFIGWKGLSSLVQAFGVVRKTFPQARLVFVGQGGERARLEREAADLGILGQVVFHPAVPHSDLNRLLRCADAFVLPSLADEAFGMSLAEAMACGVPGVGARVGGIPEVTGDAGGILVEPRQPAALAEAIVKILGDKELAARLGQNGLRRVSEKFSWQKVVDRLERVYKRILS